MHLSICINSIVLCPERFDGPTNLSHKLIYQITYEYPFHSIPHHEQHLRGVRVISTAERTPDKPIGICIYNQLHRAVRAPSQEEQPERDEEPMPPVRSLLDDAARAPLAVVVYPEPGGQYDGQGREADRARERKEVVEDGDGAGEHEGQGREPEGDAEPGAPVHRRVGLQVLGVAQEAHEDVLRRDVDV